MSRIQNKEIIVVADDFGMSSGVNASIIEAHKKGYLTHASIMVNAEFTNEAVKLAKKTPKLKVGLHIDLITGNVLDGRNKLSANSFIGILLLLIKKDKVALRKIYREIEAQINQGKKLGLNFSHMDGHLHTHMIPAIFKITQRLAAKHKIDRVRIVNESLLHTLFSKPGIKGVIEDKGIIKYLLLKSFYYVNQIKSDYYFCSILNSCRISTEFIKNLKIPGCYKKLEIMLHPGNPLLDKKVSHDREHLLSNNRIVEFETALHLKEMIDDK